MTHIHRQSSLQARPHSASHHVREEPQHTFTGGQIPAGQTALGRSPCQGGAATHVHRRSNPCRLDRTRQVAVSVRSHDTRSQAVKSLPARPHSAGHRVREEPQHTFTGSQMSAGQTTLGRSLCQGGAATHVYRQSGLPCRPDPTRQVAVSGRSCDTCTQAVIPAGQTALSWSPCQGGAAAQIHMLARSHSLKYCKLTSLDVSSSKELYITTTTLS